MRIPRPGTALFVWLRYVIMEAHTSTSEGACVDLVGNLGNGTPARPLHRCPDRHAAEVAVDAGVLLRVGDPYQRTGSGGLQQPPRRFLDL